MMAREPLQVHKVFVHFRSFLKIGESEFPRKVIPPIAMSVLISYSETIPDTANTHFEGRSKIKNVVGMTPEGIRDVDTWSLASCAKHSF
jgi:hypothetical protein